MTGLSLCDNPSLPEATEMAIPADALKEVRQRLRGDPLTPEEPSHYDRLQQIKAKYGSQNLFCLSANIAPVTV
jgi:hypothetical protein